MLAPPTLAGVQLDLPDTYPRLRLTIENRDPVELLDLTTSFLSVGDEYRHFLVDNPGAGDPRDVRLFVERIQAGSIVTDLIAIAPAMLGFAEHANTVLDFGGYLRGAMSAILSGRTEGRYDRRTYTNLNGIVEPIAKDNGSQLVISNVYNGDVTQVFNLESTDANALQNLIRTEVARLREPIAHYHSQVVLYWHQARGNVETSVGDQGVIESLSTSPVKVVFVDPTLKGTMLHTDDPFSKTFIVDVQVETVEGRPVLYKVTAVHGEMDRTLPNPRPPELDY